jgi:hypothetical protein
MNSDAGLRPSRKASQPAHRSSKQSLLALPPTWKQFPHWHAQQFGKLATLARTRSESTSKQTAEAKFGYANRTGDRPLRDAPLSELGLDLYCSDHLAPPVQPRW